MYPCADGATPLPGSVGGGTSCAQRTSLMLLKKPSKLGFLQNPHPYRLPPKLLPVRVSGYALNSHLGLIVFSLLKGDRTGLGASTSKNLQGPLSFQNASEPFRTLQFPGGPQALTRRFAAARRQDPLLEGRQKCGL